MSRRDEPAPGGSSRVRFAALAIGTLLAIGATGTLVLSDDPKVLRLAIVVALWAFVIGAMAGVRRRPSEAPELAPEQAGPGMALELRRAYQVEREQDAAARREYEAQLAEHLRRGLDEGLRRHVESLREEVQSLRSEMQDLLDGELRVERVQFESTRLTGAQGRGRGQQTGNIPTIDAEYGRQDQPKQALPAGQQPRPAQRPMQPPPPPPPRQTATPDPAYRVPPPPPMRAQPPPMPSGRPDPLFDPLPASAVGPATPFEQTRFGSDTGEFARPTLAPQPQPVRQEQPPPPQRHQAPARQAPQELHPQAPPLLGRPAEVHSRHAASPEAPPNDPAAPSYLRENTGSWAAGRDRPAQELSPLELRPPELRPPELRPPAAGYGLPGGFPPAAPTPPGTPQPGYPQPGYPQAAPAQSGYPPAGHSQSGHSQSGHRQADHAQSGYSRPGGYQPPRDDYPPPPAQNGGHPSGRRAAPEVSYQPNGQRAEPPAPQHDVAHAAQDGGGRHGGRHSVSDQGAPPEAGGRRRRYREDGEVNDVLNRVLGER
jgi:Domain of unknown function (DUF6779)